MYEMLDAKGRRLFGCWVMAMIVLYPILLVMTLSEACDKGAPFPQVFWPWCFSSHPFQLEWKHEGGDELCNLSVRTFFVTAVTLFLWIPFIKTIIEVRRERRGERRGDDSPG